MTAKAAKGADEEKLTRRKWLIMQACLQGAHPFLAVEAVASVAIEHPEWDMEEEKTWAEWTASERSRSKRR